MRRRCSGPGRALARVALFFPGWRAPLPGDGLAVILRLAFAHALFGWHGKDRLSLEHAPATSRHAVGFKAKAAVVVGPEMGAGETHREQANATRGISAPP